MSKRRSRSPEVSSRCRSSACRTRRSANRGNGFARRSGRKGSRFAAAWRSTSRRPISRRRGLFSIFRSRSGLRRRSAPFRFPKGRSFSGSFRSTEGCGGSGERFLPPFSHGSSASLSTFRRKTHAKSPSFPASGHTPFRTWRRSSPRFGGHRSFRPWSRSPRTMRMSVPIRTSPISAGRLPPGGRSR